VSIEVFLTLLAFAFVTSITPGPNNLMLLSSGVNFGFRRTVPHMLGIGAGFVALLLGVGAGLGAVLAALPWAFGAIKIAGGVYLLYLAYGIARSGPLEAKGDGSARPMGFWAAAAFQWVNPKAWVMAVSAMSAYPDPDHYSLTMLIVAAAFGVVNLPCVSSWAGLGTVLRNWLAVPARLRMFNWTMAALLVLSLWPMLR
jgi:threonine/homoserine/homoserine lactone efflux protein